MSGYEHMFLIAGCLLSSLNYDRPIIYFRLDNPGIAL